MSYNHRTIGWDKFEAIVAGLEVEHIEVTQIESAKQFARGYDCDPESQFVGLRTGSYIDPDGRLMAIEEYLALEDMDCDGSSQVSALTYPDGERPMMYRCLLLPGSYLPDWFLCINTGERLQELPEGATIDQDIILQ